MLFGSYQARQGGFCIWARKKEKQFQKIPTLVLNCQLVAQAWVGKTAMGLVPLVQGQLEVRRRNAHFRLSTVDS
jgi:hypothetical protein